MKFSVSVLALLLTASAVQAADLIVEDQVVIDEVAAMGVIGVIEVGALAQYVENTSDPFDGWGWGGYLSGALWGGGDGFVGGVDIFAEGNNFETANFVPTYTALLGAHAGFGGDGGMIGAFGSVGVVPDRDDESNFGYTAGIEGLAHLGGVDIFAQVGWADIRTDEDDSGFTGAFARAGAVFALSDDFAVMADISYGQSADFTQPGDEGTFLAGGAKLAFALPTDFDAFVTVAYEGAFYDAIGDGDTGVSHTAKLGISIPFADGNSAATALNPLATSPAPYRAGSWGSALN